MLSQQTKAYLLRKVGEVEDGQEIKWSGLVVSWNEKKMQQKLDKAILALVLRLRSPYE